MKIDDYRKADCRLFRLPPIDTSVVSGVIESALIKAWETGSSVENAMNQVLRNDDVLKKLTEQVSENLEFQRATALQQVESEKKENIKAYKEEYDTKLQHVQESLGGVIAEKEAKLSEVSKNLSEKYSGYTASQKRLEEMRARLQKKLKEVGGEAGLETLLTINDMLTKPKAEMPKAPAYKYKVGQQTHLTAGERAASPSTGYAVQEPSTAGKTANYGLNDALNLATTKKEFDPLKGSTLKSMAFEKVTEEKQDEGKVHRFFQKVWKVLNYKVW